MLIIVEVYLAQEYDCIFIDFLLLAVFFANIIKSINGFLHLRLHNEPLRTLIQIKECRYRTYEPHGIVKFKKGHSISADK